MSGSHVTMSAFQSAKLAIVSFLSLPKDALHVYVGLIIFLGAMVTLRKPMRSLVPWLVVLLLALAGEMWDGYDDLRSLGHLRPAASWHDIWNTLFWPTALLLLARLRLIGINSARG